MDQRGNLTKCQGLNCSSRKCSGACFRPFKSETVLNNLSTRNRIFFICLPSRGMFSGLKGKLNFEWQSLPIQFYSYKTEPANVMLPLLTSTVCSFFFFFFLREAAAALMELLCEPLRRRWQCINMSAHKTNQGADTWEINGSRPLTGTRRGTLRCRGGEQQRGGEGGKEGRR